MDLSRGMGSEELLVGLRSGLAFGEGSRIEVIRSEKGLEEVQRECKIRGIHLVLNAASRGDRFFPDERVRFLVVCNYQTLIRPRTQISSPRKDYLRFAALFINCNSYRYSHLTLDRISRVGSH